jgi:outer membrane protein TolC
VAFWEAALAQRLLPRVAEVLAAAEQALDRSRATLGLRNVLEVLRYQQGLLDVVRTLRQLEGRLQAADATLAALLSLPPTQRVRCALPGERRLELLDVSELPALERLVLARRADLRELAYQERIDAAEVKRKMVEMVPGVALLGGVLNHSTSSAVMHRNWQEAGLQVSKNLMEVFTGTSQRRVDRARAQLEMNRQRALALSVAALVQLHTGFWDWHSKRALYLLAEELQEVAGRIVTVMSHQAASGVQGELSHIQADVNLLQVELERDLAYVALRRSLGQIFVATGLDPVGDLDIDSVAASELSTRIDEYLAGRMALLKTRSTGWAEREGSGAPAAPESTQ